MANHKKLAVEPLESRQLMAVDFELLQDLNTKTENAASFAVLGAIGNEVAFSFNAPDSLRFRDQLWEMPADESGPAHPLHDAGNLATIGTTNVVAVNGRYLFNRASNLPEEDGLWSTDGTPAGSVRLGPSSIDTPTIAAGLAYYFVHQYEGTSLWVTDGTVAGTQMIAENGDEQNFLYDLPLATDGNQVYLLVREPSAIRHIATIDANHKVVPLVEFPMGSTQQLEFIGNGKLLITNDPGFYNGQSELYSYSADLGLVLISDKAAGLINLPYLQLSGGKAFFASDGFSFWSTDGTSAGTSRILDSSYRFSERPAVAAIGNHYLFTAYHGSGIQYFYSDGTANGTINLGVNDPGLHLHFSIATTTDAFYFIGADDSNQHHLCRVDANSGALQLLDDISLGDLTSLPEDGRFLNPFPTVVNNRIFYIADSALREYLPLKNKSIQVSPELGTAGNSLEFFAESDHYAWFKLGRDIWQTDGSTGTTKPVDFSAGELKPEFFYHPQVIDGRLVFEGLANSFPGPAEVGRWSVDPHTGKAQRLNLSNTFAQSQVVEIPNGKFQIRIEGTTRGVYQISDDLLTERLVAVTTVNLATADVELTAFDSRMMIVTNSELWHSDGTAAGTFRVHTLDDSDMVNPDLHLDKNGNLLFVTNTRQIYRIDLGSTQATLLGTLTENGIWYDLSTHSFMPTDDGIVFVGVKFGGSFKEKNLWFSNGSETRLLRDFTNGEEDVTPMLLGKAGDRVIVGSGNQRLGYSLWSTDGTAEGTVRILHTPRGLTWPTWEKASQTPDGRLIFKFFDAQLGREIWITDGTATGTELFADIASGASNSNPQFRFFGDKVLAFATTLQYGAQEPFIADFNQFVSAQSNSDFRSIVDENDRGAFLGSVALRDIPTKDQVAFRLHDLQSADRYRVDTLTGELRLQPTFAFDFESEEAATVDVDVDYLDPFSQKISTRQVTVGIQVVNQIEAPIIHDQIFEVDENLAWGHFIGKVKVDAERDATINFRHKGGWAFFAGQKSGIASVYDPALMDYEWHPEMDFYVTANDSQNSLSATAKITVRLRNVDEPPVLSSQLAPAPRTIFSGTVSTFQFAVATFVDPEEQPVTYSVTWTDGSDLPNWLAFNANTRVLSASPSQKEIGVYTFLLKAIDVGGNESSTSFQITVLDGQFPWHNALSPLDVNRDGSVSPVDALLIINRLNLNSDRTLPSKNSQATYFYDTNRDGVVSPHDVLLTINELNKRSGGGEGEQASSVQATIAKLAYATIDDLIADLFGPDLFGPGEIARKRRAK